MAQRKISVAKQKMSEAEAEQLLLVDWLPSPFAARVRIALAEKGLKYESKEENFPNKSDLLLQMNPVHKLLPVLIHNGKPICESLIIVQYIDEVWNHEPKLLPSDPYQRAHARFWADYIEKKIHQNTRRMVWASENEVKEASKKEVIEGLKILEGEIGEKPYFGGERFGYVDLVLIPIHSSIYTLEMMANLSLEVECPKLMKWAKKCMQKESVSKSLCDQLKLYETLLELRKKLGIDQ
ncbi:hypothetical protein JCGZ_06275 [Jatropha curcas]|uniref:glutathione transferase n=1 Tax=Jatropha curcas TaxID=180498 RepID=A0A067KZI0_JATCU|nr:probable glutathione S-transferase parC [Jatropha curcas]KDP37219.1 hypothetical protein JCGZ_06275 [Jatropha curcas]